MLSTLTSKGQLTLPKEVREYLGLKNGDKVSFTINETGRVEMSPARTTMKQLKGMLPSRAKEVTLEDMEAAIQEEGGNL